MVQKIIALAAQALQDCSPRCFGAGYMPGDDFSRENLHMFFCWCSWRLAPLFGEVCSLTLTNGADGLW